MNILVSNHSLDKVGGTETFTYTIIEELKRIGHTVEYFTFKKGFVSEKIESDLEVFFMTKNRYDLILANHNTTVNHLYRKGFIIQTCHGIFPHLEQPHVYADAYVAISQEVQNHLAQLDCTSILIYNSINLERFKPVNPINKKLESLLSLCHSEEANIFIRQICDQLNIRYSQAFKYEEPIWRVEERINDADVVVGLGRSAYEAMSCARPVIIFDRRRYFDGFGDGYIRNSLGLSIQNNCSGRYSEKVFTKSHFIDSLKQYNSDDGIFYRNFAEHNFDVKKNIQLYLKYHQTLLKRRKEVRRLKKIIFIKNTIGKKNFNALAKIYKGKK